MNKIKQISPNPNRYSNIIALIALAFIVYMPLHVFIAQSASLLTGGLDVWKAAKDIILVLLVPLLLYVSYRRGLFADRFFRWFIILGSLYALLHALFVVFDSSDDTYSAIVGSVYNTRLLGYLLLGYVVGVSKQRDRYLSWLLTAAVLVASAVAIFGVLQYFLPGDLLTHVGYSIERGVKPLFYIDDKPDLPRIMSTLRDPNSLGAYLIVPILLVGITLFKNDANKMFFVRPFRRGTLAAMLVFMISALLLTFSRGAAVGLILAIVTILYVVTGQKGMAIIKKYWLYLVIIFAVLASLLFAVKDTYVFQNVFFHADQSTVLADPNELRVSLTQEALDEVIDQPQGYGPGTAGLVSINNPRGSLLTENYYLQVAYEVGWAGIVLFILITSLVMFRLIETPRSPFATVLFASGLAYAFYALLVHLWSNEAVALQWWLLSGLCIGLKAKKQA